MSIPDSGPKAYSRCARPSPCRSTPPSERECDAPTAPFVAVVSESFVRRYWPWQDPIGRHFKMAFFDRVIAGVVADVRARGIERQSEPQVYVPYQQIPDGYMPFYVPKDL